VTIQAAIGLGPLYAFQDGIARHTGMTIGDAVMVTGVFFVFVALCLKTRPGVGTLVYPFLSGLSLNVMLPHLPHIHGWGLRLPAVVVATVFMAFGGALVFRAALGVSSYDSVMLGLHKVTGRPLAPLRLAMELTMLLAGWVLGGAIGVGTVLTGLMIGPGLQFWIRVLGGLPPTMAAAPAAGGAAPATAPGGGEAEHHVAHTPLGILVALVEPPSVEAATYEAAGVDEEGGTGTDPG
jgi:uncharacterized membrane protein YczE